jgi:hypothetical protein
MAEETTSGGLSGRGAWIAILVVVLLFLVIPGVIVGWTPGALGYVERLIVLGMIPALAFGVFGVWLALRHGRE